MSITVKTTITRGLDPAKVSYAFQSGNTSLQCFELDNAEKNEICEGLAKCGFVLIVNRGDGSMSADERKALRSEIEAAVAFFLG